MCVCVCSIALKRERRIALCCVCLTGCQSSRRQERLVPGCRRWIRRNRLQGEGAVICSAVCWCSLLALPAPTAAGTGDPFLLSHSNNGRGCCGSLALALSCCNLLSPSNNNILSQRTLIASTLTVCRIQTKTATRTTTACALPVVSLRLIAKIRQQKKH